VIYLVVVAGGVVLGLIVGRWWTLAAAVAVGIWITATAEVEVPSWILGVGYSVLSAAGIAAGVLIRRRAAS
jgi:hypothetical protein